MWNRACPLCFVKVPRRLVLSRGADLSCPSCRTALELSRTSRVCSAAVGLLVAYLVASAVSDASARGGWIWSVLGALFGYALGSAWVVYFLADLVVRPEVSVGHFPQPQK